MVSVDRPHLDLKQVSRAYRSVEPLQRHFRLSAIKVEHRIHKQGF